MFPTSTIPPSSARRAAAFALATLLIVPLAACGEESNGESSAPSGGERNATSTTSGTGSGTGSDAAPGAASWDDPEAGTSDGAPTITAPDGPPPAELAVTDITVGDGTEVTDRTVALVDYVGANYSNGKVFDASFGRAPFAVSVGVGMVIPGWDQGLMGMKVGGRRQLVIPPDLAYGAEARGDIGANETLIFIIDLLDVLERPVVDKVATTDGKVAELGVTDIEPGDGDRVVAAGDRVDVHYVGVHGATGEEFDASWNTGRPFSLTVGNGEVISGWDEGLVGMKLGGRRRLEIPGSLAYGPDGRPPTIGPDETLVFVVDVVGIT